MTAAPTALASVLPATPQGVASHMCYYHSRQQQRAVFSASCKAAFDADDKGGEVKSCETAELCYPKAKPDLQLVSWMVFDRLKARSSRGVVPEMMPIVVWNETLFDVT
jgi:hypothetical protein